MNINSNAIRILCFGDSNTWGFVPVTKERLPINLRWTGTLQKKLGNDFEIIEEGLNSRTTNTDDPDRPGKNGKTYLTPCLQTHNPLDFVVFMLGTNDLKEVFQRSPQQTASGAEDLLNLIKEYGRDKNSLPSKIIIISPPLVDEGVEGMRNYYLGAEEKSKQLGPLYKKLAQKYNCEFIDAAQIVTPSPKDGLHLEPADHQKLAEAVYSKIKSIKL